MKHPRVLDEYREDKAKRTPPPLDHEQLSEIEEIAPLDWDGLIQKLRECPVGAASADTFERLIEEILSALFYPSLCNPTKQHRIHEGRKRIDITYTNEARAGFFEWLAKHYPCAFIFVECKNYGKELGNPEVDQLSGRFSHSRGRVGLLVCRSVENAASLQARCTDTAKDDRGFIMYLTDEDLIALIKQAKSGVQSMEFPLLTKKFRALVD